MTKINIKPLSTNEAWKGRRFKTEAYKSYEKSLHFLLPKKQCIPEGLLSVSYTFGVSTRNCDFDNFIKQFQDVLSKKYEFNDNRIYYATINKVDVAKGDEFIEYKIKEYEEG